MTTPPKNYADRKTFKIYVPEYRNAMLQVAKDFKCNYIDLSKLSTDYFNFRGKNYVNTLYMKLNPGQYPAWEQGINDDTHFQRDGARVLARIIAVDLQANRQIPMLNKQFRQNTNALYATFQEAATYKNKNNTQTNHGIIWSSSAIMHGRSYILQVQQINNAIRQNNL